MPIKRIKVWVVVCPICDEKLEGCETAYEVYETRVEAKESNDIDERQPLEQEIAERCGEECSDAYRNRKPKRHLHQECIERIIKVVSKKEEKHE